MGGRLTSSLADDVMLLEQQGFNVGAARFHFKENAYNKTDLA